MFMTLTIFLGIGIVVALLIGFFLGKISQGAALKVTKEQTEIQIQEHKNTNIQQAQFYEMQKLDFQNRIFKLEAAQNQLLVEKHDLDIALHKKDTEFDLLLDKLNTKEKEMSGLQEKFKLEFEQLAQKILDDKSLKFTTINAEKIHSILQPLQEKIKNFEEHISQNQRVTIDYQGQLKAQIDGLQKLSLKMNEETLNLTRALKSEAKTQGNWGELILEKVLEKSGLEKGREYTVQTHMVNEDHKRVFPDVIINLPDHKKMVVDSKVSLTAYERYVNESNEQEKQEQLKLHVLSINQHIDSLSTKRYQDLFPDTSPDFVLLFIPIESAFAVAIDSQHNLYSRAFDKNIIVVTPTTLLATLRTINSMWTNQKQQENAQTIAKEAGALYDKFVGLLNDLQNMGSKIKALDKDYNAAISKLYEGNGNLVKRVERLKELGAKATKNISN